MNNENVIVHIRERMEELDFTFTSPPLIIGGCAMEYYDLRKTGEDIDLIITDGDYQRLAARHPDNRKDIYGDLGVILPPFEIWRSIALIDYDFYSMDSADYGGLKMVSADKLLLMRVFAMNNKKYMDDLVLLRDGYYHARHTNPQFYLHFEKHRQDYDSNHGVIMGGQYDEQAPPR